MAQKTTMKIAFQKGGIIPAAELRPQKRDGKDKVVSPHESATVSATYGQQLVDDKFAYKCGKEKQQAYGKASGKDDAETFASAKTALTEAEAELAAASDEAAKTAAQGKIDAAKAALLAREGK